MTKKADPFLELITKQKAAKDKKFTDALAFAKSEVYTPSGERFVDSCQEFFNKRGYLTEDQIVSLYSIGQRRDWVSGDIIEDEDEVEPFPSTSGWGGCGDEF